MRTRNLAREEWTAFFNAFSRRYVGQPTTIEMIPWMTGARPQTIARKMPLGGITAEHDGTAAIMAIEIMVGDSPREHLMHVIRDPCRVQIAQVTNGADELLLIDTEGGPTTRVDFSRRGLDAALSETATGAASRAVMSSEVGQ
jgi:hypothetical protein